MSTTSYKKIYQYQGSLSLLNSSIREKFLAYDTDNSHLLYSPDGETFTKFYNSSEIDTKIAECVPLNSSNKIDLTYFPDSILGQVEYVSTWDASSNSPTLPTASTVKGHYYIVSTAGTYNNITFGVGDWVISDGTSWGKVDNTDSISSFIGRTGAIVAQSDDYSAYYPLLSGSYSNPSWINNINYSKIVGSSSESGFLKITNGVASLSSLDLSGYLPLTAGSSYPLSSSLYSQSIIPTSNQGYDLGSSSFEWNNIYTFKLLPQAVTSSHALGSTTNYWWSIYGYNLHVRNNEIGGGIIWDSTILRTTANPNTLECDGTSLYFTNSSGTRSTLALSSSLSGTYLPLTAGSSYPLTSSLYSQSIIPTSSGSYDLGSGSAYFNNAYIASLHGVSAILSGALSCGNANTYNIVPNTTSTYNLGNSSLCWNNIYGNYVYAANAAMATWAPSSAFAWFGYTGLNNNTNGNSGFLHQSNGNPFVCGITSVILQVASANKMSLDSSNINAYANIIPNATATYNLGSSSYYWATTYTNAVNIAGAGIWRTYTGNSTYCFAYGTGVTPGATNYSMGFDSAATMAWLNASNAVYININSSSVMSFASGAMTAYGNIVPSANNTYNLGSSSYAWNNIYANYAIIGNTGIGYWNYATSQFWVGYKGLNSASAAYGLNGDANGSIGLYAIDGYGVNIGTSNTYNTLVVKTGVVTSQANILPYSNSVYYLGDTSHYWQTTFSNYIYTKYSGIDIGYFSQNGTYASFGHKSCMSNTNFCLLQNSAGNTWLNGASQIEFQIANTAIANIISTGLSPNTTSTYNLGDSSHYWNNLYCNTINCNVINSASAITVTGGIISYTYNEAATMTPTNATGVIVNLGAYSGLTTITLSTANISAGKIIEFHNSNVNSCRFYSPNATIKIHYSTANIVTYAAGTYSATIAVNLISRVVNVGSQFDITVS